MGRGGERDVVVQNYRFTELHLFAGIKKYGNLFCLRTS